MLLYVVFIRQLVILLMLSFMIVVWSPLSYDMVQFKTPVDRNFQVTWTKLILIPFLFSLLFWVEDEHILCFSMVLRELKYSAFLNS